MRLKLQVKQLGLTTILQLIALIVTISIFLKAIIDIDTSYDTWGYHLPFAARIWQIVPAEQFINEEARFAGFALFGEFLQGFFWFISQRVQAANLACYLSLVLYFVFLKVYFQIPLYLSAIALLAIPLVQTHAATCYVDLPANLFLAAAILLTYRLYLQQNINNKGHLILLILTSAAAANTKPQLVPHVFVVLFFAVIRIVWLQWRQMSAGEKISKWLLSFISVLFLASLLIFATPIKNIVLYGNPFYPVRIEIAGKVLNHALPLYKDSPGYLANAPTAQRWLYSVLEINSPQWSVDQWSEDPNQNRMGGFFNAYAVFHLLLLGYLTFVNRCRETKVAAILFAIMSFIAAFTPQAHELRYYMYWMIALVSLNLALVAHQKQSSPQSSLVNARNLGLVCLLALAIVVTKTQFFYARPSFYSLEQFIRDRVDYGIVAAIQPEDKLCIVNQYPYTFLYTPWFHPYLNYDYSLKKAGNPSECGNRTKILGR
jgi:hypothetical protein